MHSTKMRASEERERESGSVGYESLVREWVVL